MNRHVFNQKAKPTLKSKPLFQITQKALYFLLSLAILGAISACSNDKTATPSTNDDTAPVATTQTATEHPEASQNSQDHDASASDTVTKSSEETSKTESNPTATEAENTNDNSQEATPDTAKEAYIKDEPLSADAGQKLYDSTCKTCHATGLLNAPKFGDKAAWKERIAKGKEVLYTHSAKGFNKMPPQAVNGVSDAQVHAAVDYMVEHSQ